MQIRTLRSSWTSVATLGAVVAAVLAAALGTVAVLAPAPPAAAAGPVTCTQDWRPAAIAAYLTAAGQPTDPPVPLPPAPAPTDRAFHVFCDGRYVSTVWRPATDADPAVLDLAAQMVAHLAYPSVRLGVNPTRGLTGLPSWFWAVPDAEVHMLPGNGPNVDLQVRPTTVQWSFGDGSPGAHGLGSAYPTPSPVQHVYERTGSYAVRAQVQIEGTFRVATRGGAVSGSAEVTVRYEVAQVRSLLHSS